MTYMLALKRYATVKHTFLLRATAIVDTPLPAMVKADFLYIQILVNQIYRVHIDRLHSHMGVSPDFKARRAPNLALM